MNAEIATDNGPFDDLASLQIPLPSSAGYVVEVALTDGAYDNVRISSFRKWL
jgi:hypothetical protein